MIFGLGRQKPHHYREMLRVAWENRDQLPFAWRILRDGVCDGCALGTSGMKDWTVSGPHLCMVRLELMRLNTAPPLDPSILSDVRSLKANTSTELRALGRLPEPMIRRRGEPGFLVATWEEALDLIAGGLRAAEPSRTAFYLTSRGLTNEVYYTAQKAARALGTHNVDNSARLCHAASTTAMTATLGYGASTCSYKDWIGADLIVAFGSNIANNQPVTMKYLYVAKERGAKVAVVNPYREPGLARYWVPSIPKSALFGTAIADEWFDVRTGGDIAFLIGALRALIEIGGIDAAFVRERTTGFDDASRRTLEIDWETLERASGMDRRRMHDFARLLVDRPKTVFIWSMGLTQHAHGAPTISALINLALARGIPAREHSGLVPIRGHSGVQGGAEVGCVPVVNESTAARWTDVWGFPVRAGRGWTAVEMIDHAAAGDVDVLWMVGGNFLETIADEDRSKKALSNLKLRVHHDLVLSSSMLADCDGDVVILPAATRYESPGGGTETSTERRIIFSPEIPGRRVGSARPEWTVFNDVIARACPERGLGLGTAEAIRAEISRAVPLYRGIDTLKAKGDQVQWGGPRLYADGRFGTPDAKAHFSMIENPVNVLGQTNVAKRVKISDLDRTFVVSTRRGKQFNSMVQRDVDPLTGAGRDAVLISEDDLKRLNLKEHAVVRLRSDDGLFEGRLRAAAIKPGNLEVHWPEANVLLSGAAIDPDSKEPDYNAVVTLEAL